MMTKACLRASARARQGNRRSPLAADPYYQGDTARHEGKPMEANPYAAGTEAHADWLQGWREYRT